MASVVISRLVWLYVRENLYDLLFHANISAPSFSHHIYMHSINEVTLIESVYMYCGNLVTLDPCMQQVNNWISPYP